MPAVTPAALSAALPGTITFFESPPEIAICFESRRSWAIWTFSP
jgi:hypothetical protein